jgi:hypothetical protein
MENFQIKKHQEASGSNMKQSQNIPFNYQFDRQRGYIAG